MYLNIILTILCVILLVIFISCIYFWKKYLKNFLKPKNEFHFKSNMTKDFHNPFDIINEIMKNMPKR